MLRLRVFFKNGKGSSELPFEPPAAQSSADITAVERHFMEVEKYQLAAIWGDGVPADKLKEIALSKD